jgi:stearoyl-CoA desaturase (delta-9 desaturase)
MVIAIFPASLPRIYISITFNGFLKRLTFIPAVPRIPGADNASIFLRSKNVGNSIMNIVEDEPLLSDPPVSLLASPPAVDPRPAEEENESNELRPWLPARNTRWATGLDWTSAIWLGVIHLGAVAALFFFTWKALGLFLLLSWLTGGLGVCLGYHRLLTHASFKTFPWMRRLLALLGSLSGEGPPITWVAVHRLHHRHSDAEGDPHSPQDGGWWSHILWLFPRPRNPDWRQMRDRYGKDLLKDPFMRRLDKTFILWHFALGSLLFAAGWRFWDLYTGISLLTWGSFLRAAWVMHVTWCVNSASHLWGYRNYETSDNSRNLWWVGLLAYGEGWHNNHHAFPGRARHGHRWWEIDLTYATICLLEKCGLVWNVLRGKKDAK